MSAVEWCTRYLANDLVEFPSAAGARHLHPVQVIVQIGLAILQPHRMVKPKWDIYQAIAHRFEQMHPTRQRAAEHVKGVLTLEFCSVDDGDLQRVVVHVG